MLDLIGNIKQEYLLRRTRNNYFIDAPKGCRGEGMSLVWNKSMQLCLLRFCFGIATVLVMQIVEISSIREIIIQFCVINTKTILM